MSSYGCSLRCIGWDYKKLKFIFEDTDGKVYEIDEQKLLATFPLLFTDKWPKGCTQPPISNGIGEWEDWLGQSDATDFGAFVQLVCFGEVIYG